MVLIVLPAYNEGGRIGRVIRGLFEHGYRDVLVVDDGSKDNTAAEAVQAGARVVRHSINRGQGAALETGNEYARRQGAAAVVHFDADGQFDPADIAGALAFLQQEKLGAVLGSRFLDARSHIPFFKRCILLPISRYINFVFTGVLLSDAHNGFRILSREALAAVSFKQDRMAHNTECVQELRKKKISFKEFPVAVSYNRYGQGAAGGFKIIHDLLIGLFF